MRRWTVTVVSMLLLGATTVGCSGGSDDATSATTSTTVDFDVTTTLPPDEQAVVDECDAKMRAAAPDLAGSAFPESEVQWTVVDLVAEVGLAFVEVEPAPAEGLKPRYRLVVECHAGSEPVLYGVYALEGETWTLAMTTDALGDAELPPTLG